MSSSDMVKFGELEQRVETLEQITRTLSVAIEALETVVEGLVDKAHGKVVHDEVLGPTVSTKDRQSLRNTLEQARGPNTGRPNAG